MPSQETLVAEYEEQTRKQVEHDACRAREKTIREETERRTAREKLRVVEAGELYNLSDAVKGSSRP